MEPARPVAPPRWPRLHPAALAAVFAGGCAGGLARYALTRAWPAPAGGFPWATFAINTSGALALALLLALATEVLPPGTMLRPLLGTGFCGAWTTFSSVAASCDLLVSHGRATTAMLYLAASVIAGLLAAAAGLAGGRMVGAARHRAGRAGAP